MAHLLKVLISAGLITFAGLSHAGYAQTKPPDGWSKGSPGKPVGPGGVYRFGAGGAAANEAQWLAKTVRTSTSLNVGGRLVTMPATMRFAANASRAAATAYSLNPWLLGAAGIAWLASECIVYQGGSFNLTCGGNTPPVSDGRLYKGRTEWFKFPSDACADTYSGQIGNIGTRYVPGTDGGICYMDFKNPNSPYDTIPGRFQRIYSYSNENVKGDSACPAGWYVTPAGCVQTPPPQTVTPEEVVEKLAPKPLPSQVPKELPDVEWPVEMPRINPSPEPESVPQPMRVPIGEPQPIPNTDPAKWKQPVIDVVPAPIPQSPWRVDLQPKDIEKPSPDGITEPIPVPVPLPDAEPNPDPGSEPVVKPADPGLCDLYPDIVACAKLGEVEKTDLKDKSVALSIDKDTGWEFGTPACPAPKVVMLAGKPFTFEIQALCDFATGIKPVVVGLAWITAMLGFIGLSRKS